MSAQASGPTGNGNVGPSSPTSRQAPSGCWATGSQAKACRVRLLGVASSAHGQRPWRSGQTIGYRGPAPPPGKVHHYQFRIYALDQSLAAEPGLDKAALVKAMDGHVLAQGQLVGTYRR